MRIGLPICRSIIEAHGARLWIVANEPRGLRSGALSGGGRAEIVASFAFKMRPSRFESLVA